MYPVLKAADALGGSGNKKEILDRVIDDLDVSEELLAIVYGGEGEERRRNKSMFFDRLEWALSYCKLTGVLDSPGRALYALRGGVTSGLQGPFGMAMAWILIIDTMKPSSSHLPRRTYVR